MSIVGVVIFSFLVSIISVLFFSIVQKKLKLTPFQTTALNVLIACTVVWVLQQQVFQKPDEQVREIKVGESFRAQVNEQDLIQPLFTEVNFNDTDTPPAEHKTIVVEMPHMVATFDPYGAVITQMVCKKTLDNKPGELVLWSTDPVVDREQGAFLIALRHNTPLRYELVSQVMREHDQVLKFSTQTSDCTIEKEFVLHADSYQIDMTLHMSNVSAAVQPRVFLPAPYLGEVLKYDVVHGIVFTDREKIEKFTPAQAEGRLWVRPTLFGAEDKYFITALVKDSNMFIERAYYRLQGTHRVMSIFEGPTVKDDHTWKLSFYCGPKQMPDLTQVDSRLVATLDYGWMSPVCKLLFAALKYIYTFVQNYGWAIVILTVLLKLVMLPFTMRAEASPKRMMDLQKRMQAIERKYKDDKAGRDEAMSELIRKHGLGDMLGFGCLQKVLLQGVVFIGLNRVLSVAFELYRAPFIGWITNLAATDPYYILPLLTGIGIFMQMRNAGEDPRQFVTAIMMTLIIIGVMVNLAAGVVLFSCVSAWLDILQGFVQRKMSA